MAYIIVAFLPNYRVAIVHEVMAKCPLSLLFLFVVVYITGCVVPRILLRVIITWKTLRFYLELSHTCNFNSWRMSYVYEPSLRCHVYIFM